MTHILIIYYSAYGHIFEMANAVQKGVKEVPDVDVRLTKIEEFDIAKKFLEKQESYRVANEKQKDIPVVTPDDLRWADGIIWGIPTRYGLMPAQMKQFLDANGGMWARGELENKVASAFDSTGSIHGGQESTLLTSIVPFLHFGMIYVGLPYMQNPEQMTTEGLGGTPYGATTLSGSDGSRKVDQLELKMAESLGKHVSEVTKALKDGGFYDKK